MAKKVVLVLVEEPMRWLSLPIQPPVVHFRVEVPVHDQFPSVIKVPSRRSLVYVVRQGALEPLVHRYSDTSRNQNEKDAQHKERLRS
jgi:hypothetical protein